MTNRTKIIRLLEPQIKEFERIISYRERQAYSNALYILGNDKAPRKTINRIIERLKKKEVLN